MGSGQVSNELSQKRAIAGRKGGYATLFKYGREQMILWAKKGGRPRLPTPAEVESQLSSQLKKEKEASLPNGVPPEVAAEFGASFERSGLIHFPVVRKHQDGKYQVGDGWLRRAGYVHNFAILHIEKYARIPCVVRELDDRQMADLVLDANTERRDFNPIELAGFYKKYIEDFKITQEDFAREHHISQEEVSQTIALLNLPEDIQEKIITRVINKSQGRELLRLSQLPDQQKSMADKCSKENLSVSRLSDEIDSGLYRKSKSLNPKAQPWESPPRFDIAGCQDCAYAMKLSSYSSQKKELRCTNAKCWQKKQEAAIESELEEMKAKLKEQGIEELIREHLNFRK